MFVQTGHCIIIMKHLAKASSPQGTIGSRTSQYALQYTSRTAACMLTMCNWVIYACVHLALGTLYVLYGHSHV